MKSRKLLRPILSFMNWMRCASLGMQTKVTEIIRSYWGGMLNEGATTFWEEYDPRMSGAKHLEMYHEPYDKSLCHAWGASPLYLLGKYYIGVSPTRPGYEEFEVSPSLGNLDRFQGEVPINNGYVRVKIDGKTIEIETNAGGGYYVRNGERVKLDPAKVNLFPA